MQYHLNGFQPGDPSVQTPSKLKDSAGARQNVDVLIVDCGPAGLTLAAQLAAFGDISVRIIDRKAGPLEVGQADDIACRSIEMFRAFSCTSRTFGNGIYLLLHPAGQV